MADDCLSVSALNTEKVHFKQCNNSNNDDDDDDNDGGSGSSSD